MSNLTPQASKLRTFPSYESYVEHLQTIAADKRTAQSLAAALDGEAGGELRRLIPLAERRAIGAFFTSTVLADLLAKPLAEADGHVYVVDPSCGAGDLLLGALRSLATRAADRALTVSISGSDIVAEFVQAASIRLDLQMKESGITAAVDIRHRDGLTDPAIANATHILLNPPYGLGQTPPGCTWAKGAVNEAALFMAQLLPTLEDGCQVNAILPDVLRSGTRYRRWREVVSRLLDINEISPIGRFDTWTDVDVFVLRGVLNRNSSCRSEWVRNTTGETVGSLFAVSVGSVVDFRHPKLGRWHPYLTPKDLSQSTDLHRVARHRRYKGSLHAGPLVAIPRTSSPRDRRRARGVLVTDLRDIAVDNHLIVAQPLDKSIEACRQLLKVLSAGETDDWLNEVMRCRHLTVKSIKSIPWQHHD